MPSQSQQLPKRWLSRHSPEQTQLNDLQPTAWEDQQWWPKTLAQVQTERFHNRPADLPLIRTLMTLDVQPEQWHKLNAALAGVSAAALLPVRLMVQDGHLGKQQDVLGLDLALLPWL
jgi:hypothetical protein